MLLWTQQHPHVVAIMKDKEGDEGSVCIYIYISPNPNKLMPHSNLTLAKTQSVS
jgi:hypothetical protein